MRPRSALACLARGFLLPSGGIAMDEKRRVPPQKSGKESRSSQINFRLSIVELERLKQEADTAGMGVSDYVRRRTLGRPVVAQTDRMMVNELRRLGGLLKRIHLESNGTHRAETRDAILALRDAIARVATE